ncbi:MAG: conjugal transfer protein TraX [Betaproteobacteria bacterium]|nr:conjugal transfer protein TraX [Betaproteobacteria bacterium]
MLRECLFMMRMFIFAVISHFAYCFAFGISMIPFKDSIFNQTSVIYPLFVAIVVLWIQDTELPLNKWLKKIIIFVLIWTAFPADWSCLAVLAILDMYKKRGNLKKQMMAMIPYVAIYGIVSFFFVSKIYALVLFGVILVYPVLKLYNGEKGKAGWMKWFFYIYYPAHLIIVGIIRLWLYGDISLLF